MAAGLAGSTALAGCAGVRGGTPAGGGADGDGTASGADGEAEALSGSVRIAGSSTVFPISVAVGEEFQKLHPGVTVSVDSTGTGGGFGNFFCLGNTDVNDASRPIQPEEEDLCADNGVTPIEFQVAIDALTIVANRDADFVDCLTVAELREIWRPGGAETWAAVREGWPDEPLELYGAAPTSGTFDYLTESIVGEENSHREDYQATEQDNTIVQGVSGSEYAVGYFGFAYYSQNPDAVKPLAVDSGNGCVRPSLETAKSGEYSPLSRPLFVYVAREELARPEIAAFARFYLEQTPTDLVSEVGYVPMPQADADANLDRLAAILEEL